MNNKTDLSEETINRVLAEYEGKNNLIYGFQLHAHKILGEESTMVLYTRSVDACLNLGELLAKQLGLSKFYLDISFDRCDGEWKWLVSTNPMGDDGEVNKKPALALSAALCRVVMEIEG